MIQRAKTSIFFRSGGEFLDTGEKFADPAYFGLGSGGGDDGAALTGNNQRPAVDHGRTVTQSRIDSNRLDRLLDRQGFARKDRFLQLQRGCFDQTGIRRDSVTGFDQYDVARYQMGGIDLAAAVPTQNRGHGRQHPVQRRDRRLGAALLNKPDGGIYEDDGKDDECILGVTQRTGNGGGTDKDVDQQVMKLREKPPQRSRLPSTGQFIAAETGQSSRCFRFGQPAFDRIEPLHGGSNRLGLPARDRSMILFEHRDTIAQFLWLPA